MSALYVFDEYKSEAAASAAAAKLSGRGAIVRPLKSRGTWNVLVSEAQPQEARIVSFDAIREAYGPQVENAANEIAAELEAAAKDEAQQMRERIENLHGEKAARAFDAFRVVEAHDFASGEDTEPDWQVRGLIPRHGTGIHPGPSGTLKSFTELDIAACINRGVSFHGRAVTKGRAVIVVAEGARGYKRRLRAYAKHHDVPLSDLPAVIPAAPNLYEPAQISALIAQLKLSGAVTYVCFDTKWRCSVGADENSANDQGVVLGSMDRIARELDCFCMAVTHTGRDVQKGARGSSAQYAAVDTELTQERTGDFCTVRVTKQKDSEADFALTFKAVTVDLGFNSHGEPESSLVLEPVDAADAVTVKPPKGETERALWEYARTEPRFTEEAIVTDVTDILRKTKPKTQPKNVRRTFKAMAREFFILTGDDEYSLRPGIIHDNSGWLE